MDLDLVSRGIQNGFVGFGSGIGGRSDQHQPGRATSPPSGVFGSRYGKDPELKWAVVSATRTKRWWVECLSAFRGPVPTRLSTLEKPPAEAAP
jgi:hypothetical protein